MNGFAGRAPHRINGRAAETRRCAPGRAIAAALAVSIAVLAIGGVSSLAPVGAVFAQVPGTSGPISLGDLFKGPDSVGLKDGKDVVLRDHVANAPKRRCRTQKVNIKVVVAKGDLLFQNALGQARRDVIDAVLRKQGVSAERYAVDYGGMGAKDDVQVEHGDIIPDKQPPTLVMTSVRPKGSKVKAHEKIEVKMVATDRANEWQTGIKSIYLQDISTDPNGILVPQPADYGRLPDPCNAATMQRTHVVTYTVPSPAPLKVRLRALAEDFAGNIGTDIAEYPTGDWQGSIDWRTHHPTATGRNWGRLDLTIDYDGQGNLKGRMAGDEYIDGQAATCRQFTLTPAKLSANLVGQYTPGRNTMSLRVADQQFQQGQWSTSGCEGGTTSGRFGGGGPLYQPGLAQLLNSLTVGADGSVEASGEWPMTPASTAPNTLRLKLTLRRAGN